MRRIGLTLAVSTWALALMVAAALPAAASNSWGGYHWATTADPFTLKIGDNFSSSWDSYLTQTAWDWTQSSVLDLSVVPGGSSSKRCSATPGRVEVCNGSYGNNGWLGLAQIWLARGTPHITQGTVKVNDYYFSLAKYNNSSEKEHVVCQEVGHTLGLDHQDTSGKSVGTCMDYYKNTTASDTSSISPNQDDYDTLNSIYSHLDTSTTIGQAAPSPHGNSRETVSVSRASDGSTVITFIFWA